MLDLFEFETVADTSAATAGDTAGDGPSQTGPAATTGMEGAADAGETDASAVATVAAPAWSPDDPFFLETVDSLLAQRVAPLVDLIRQGAATPAPGVQTQPPMPPDPFSDNYASEMVAYQAARDEQMFARFEQMLGTVAAPLNAQMEAQTVAEGEQRLQDMLADDIARNGDFPHAPGEQTSKAQQLVRPLADMIFPEIASRFGAGPRAAEIAMGRATSLVREIVAEARASALEENTNRMSTLAGARTEPGAGAAGTQVVGETRARGIDEGLSAVTSRYRDLVRNGNGA